MSHASWPLFDLVVRTPKLELRLPADDDLAYLMPLADATIYEHMGFLPFHQDWTGDPPAAMQFHWGARANWNTAKWNLVLCPFVDDEPVGCQSLAAETFSTLRRVETGSWLLPAAQGQGVGREMRAAVLHFAFEYLGALEAHSEAHVDNAASTKVSTSLGYEITGREGSLFGDQRGEVNKFQLNRELWQQHRRDDITVEGFDGCRSMFGI